MPSGFVIRKNQYYDSVFLMGVNRRISEVKGVSQTAVLMGSQANKQLLLDIGIQDERIDAAQPNDLIVAAIADSQSIVDDVLARLDEWLQVMDDDSTTIRTSTFEEGLAHKPNANLAVISVPGEYAAREAHKSLEAGLNVFLFSDNVSIQEELELKQLASKLGLLVMGPDCGTSLIGGVGIGFANVVRRGSIGVIGVAGTGLQEFTSQVHNAGEGISHAIGTGGRDLSNEIKGSTTLAALDALEADPNTSVIAIISKPPAASTLAILLERVAVCTKPVVTCFLGIDPGVLEGKPNLKPARNVDEAVQFALKYSTGQAGRYSGGLSVLELEAIQIEKRQLSPDQKYLRGILAGGTFCYQSQQILQEAGYSIYSNSPFDKKFLLEDSDESIENTVVDMGSDFYTLGKPHPMIDGTMRIRRILAESRDPQVAVIYLDFILGFNASTDPVGELLDAIIEAKKIAKQRGGNLIFIASVCGTESDPQDKNLQTKLLQEAGVLVFSSNALATMACVKILEQEKR